VTWQPDGSARWSGQLTVEEALKASAEKTDREGEIERSRLAMMRHYAEHPGCRRSFLLTYFGQDYPGTCDNCDNDLARDDEGQSGAAPANVPFAVGARVVSERWGEGTVQRYDGDQVTVLFDEHGYRELFVPVVRERGLLHPAQP
jgi:ATP-dependent DNA helicase RecQ